MTCYYFFVFYSFLISVEIYTLDINKDAYTRQKQNFKFE
jgi:hypothetical protein